MNKKYTFICILFCLVTIFSACRSQGKIDHVERLSKQHSIRKTTTLDPEATVIHIDKMNNLWFVGREKGIYKYDGKKLIFFSSKDGLKSNKIISVQEDGIGNLYFDTPEGVFKYDGKEFTTLPIVQGTHHKIYGIPTRKICGLESDGIRKGPIVLMERIYTI